MVQLLAVTEYLDSLAEVEAQFHLSRNDDRAFFPEWLDNFSLNRRQNELSQVLQILDRLKFYP